MPRILVADIEQGVAKGIPAPTPVRDTFVKGSKVMELYEVEYHRYADLLVAAGIWKQHWADGEKYLTGDQMREQLRLDTTIIRDLTSSLEDAHNRVNTLSAQVLALEAKPTIPSDPFTDLVERIDLVWQGFGYSYDNSADARPGVTLHRRYTSFSKRIWQITVPVPVRIGDFESVNAYGKTINEAICAGHAICDLLLDWNDANTNKKRNVIKEKIGVFWKDMGEDEE